MTIYLIRHGQSKFNADYDGTGDPLWWDAGLTEKGCAQAIGLRDTSADLGIEHLICSPLTRAIQTAQLGFPDMIPQVWPLAQEHQEHSCDVGRSPDVLAAEFPELDFSALPDPWGFQGEKNSYGVPVEPFDAFKARIAQLRADLMALPKAPTALVCHGYVIEELAGIGTDNCQIVELKRKA
ncbi:MAG: phosphoglycerate mutase family protein [Litoreibacter sp.]|nr:phosphoglycerate mutase family protein [Litoreibacter sp.]